MEYLKMCQICYYAIIYMEFQVQAYIILGYIPLLHTGNCGLIK